jgi:quercetin dioxygenase-like cupin family protein
LNKLSLDALARELRGAAASSSSGRAARTVYGGHDHTLRQTLIALRAGEHLAEHTSPGEATLYVLLGRVRLNAGKDSWDGRDGDFLIIPDATHSLDAVTDCAVLLTVVNTRRRGAAVT